ncbi:MAG TPA: hypothetical protein VH109_03695 [Steroidobacteraceae bacterium]|jgi:uncharacterized membrane protein|nr:hypothetical protein [Steroidobacteraceae bacterium]
MTIREYLRTRSKRARRVLALGVIVVSVVIALFAITSNRAALFAAAGAVGLAIVFWALLYLDLTRCPSCRTRLGAQIANQYRLKPRVNFCPFCGVSFDKSEVRSP